MEHQPLSPPDLAQTLLTQYHACQPSQETVKVLTINGRGLKNKISILRHMLQQAPDILIWTEHHLPQGAQPPRWVHILMQDYKWGHTGLPNIRGQAGVLLAVHKDFLAGTEPHIPTLPAETRGFLYQMEIRRPESVPLLITGAYLPTGTSAPFIRPVLYNHIEHSHKAHPHHIHLLAGDMNAALYPTDRAQGRRGPLDKPYRQFIHKMDLLPLDQPQSQNPTQPGRPKTFYNQDDPTTGSISRIDDILVNTQIAKRPGAHTNIIDTTDLNTDHQGVMAHIPYTSLGQLPLPIIQAAQATERPRSLVTPLKKKTKNTSQPP
jgi:exonuclease III